MTTRIFNALIGIWLFVTAFMWPHTPAEMTVTVVAAILTFALAILAIYTRAASYMNEIVAVLLFLSVLTVHSLARATMWYNVIVTIELFICALLYHVTHTIRHRPLIDD